MSAIPSPKAEPVKQWLAGVGAERLQEAADLASLSEDQRRLYARDQLAEHNKTLAAAAGGPPAAERWPLGRCEQKGCWV